jgi:hypothetical protein
MPTFPLGKEASIVVNSQDYSDSCYKDDLDSTVDALDNTTHGASFHRTKQPGLIDGGFKASIYYSQAVKAALRTLMLARTVHTIVYGPESSATGKEKITLTAFITAMPQGVTPDGIPTLDVEWAFTAAPVYATY